MSEDYGHSTAIQSLPAMEFEKERERISRTSIEKERELHYSDEKNRSSSLKLKDTEDAGIATSAEPVIRTGADVSKYVPHSSFIFHPFSLLHSPPLPPIHLFIITLDYH